MAVITGNSINAVALKYAAQVIARAAKDIAGEFSTRIPPAIKVFATSSDSVNINGGSPGGKWGWTPIHAWMFSEPHSASVPKHPLFASGPRGTDGWKYWYYQPYRPFLDEAAEAKSQEAAEAYADVAFPMYARAYGYK